MADKLQKTSIGEIGSDNVFADLGLPDAEERLRRARLYGDKEYITEASERIAGVLERTLPDDLEGRDEIIEFVRRAGQTIEHLDDEANCCTMWTWPKDPT